MTERYYAALDETVWSERLPNGMDVYVIVKPEYGKQFAFFAVHYGSMDMSFQTEDGEWKPAPSGVAHYLEHKLFETEDGSVTGAFAESGAADNAFTAADMTGYYFDSTCDFEKNLRLLLSFVSNPCFTDESIQQERGIIEQEICMEEDDPYSQLYYRVMEMLYTGHPIREHIAGTEESIAKVTADMLYRCHKTFYCPDNMVLCVAGNVDPNTVSRVAREVLSTDCSPSVCLQYGGTELPVVERNFMQWIMPVSVPIFNIGVKGDPAEKNGCLRQRLIAELACDVLFGPSSGLYNRLYDEGLINGSFGGDYEYVPGAAYLLISGESRDPARVRDEIIKEAERLVRDGVDKELWERLKRASYGAMIRGLNSLENMCIELAQTHFDGEEYLSFPEIFQSIEKSDVEKLLERWCIKERIALAVVKPPE